MNNRVRYIRKTLGITQMQMSKDLCLSNGYLSKIELGQQPVNERLVKLLCDTYFVNKEWLLTGEGECFCERNVLVNDLLKTFDGLCVESQKYLINFASELVEFEHQLRNDTFNIN